MTKSFTLAVLPDTQIYAESYPHVFTAQTQWIAENRDAHNIAFVLHEGDVTNGNVEYHWQNASESMGVLDGVAPYAIVLGNHDMGPGGACEVRESPLFNQYFPVSRYEPLPTFGGTFEADRLDSSFHLFSVGDAGWLVLALEYLPRDQVLEWANDVVASHPDRRVIVVTHSHVYPDDTLHGSLPAHEWDPADFGISTEPGGVNNGAEAWDKLLRRHPTMSMAFSGHFVDRGGTARVLGAGDGGNQVHQMLANYQNMENGGEGYLRLVECDPTEGTVSVKTYSPYHDSYLTDSRNQFTLTRVELGGL